MNKKKLIEVIYIDQTNEFPTGCESVSTVICLNYHNIDISVNDFIDHYLEKGEMFSKDNKLYAPDPNDKFIGSPYDKHSYGCYSPVIEKALKNLIIHMNLDNAYEVKNLNGVSMDSLIKDYIDNDIPVIFWGTMDFRPHFDGTKWLVPETEKEITWIAREHCLLLVGYDYTGKKYYFNDPWKNHGVIGYDMELVEKRHKELLSMALAIVKK